MGRMTRRPRVVALSGAVKKLLVLPVAGFFTFQDCYAALAHGADRGAVHAAPTREDVFDAWLAASATAPSRRALREATAPVLRHVTEAVRAVAHGLLSTVRQGCKARGIRLAALLPLPVRESSRARHARSRSHSDVPAMQAARLEVPRTLQLHNSLFSRLAFVAQLEALANSHKTLALRRQHVAACGSRTWNVVRGAHHWLFHCTARVHRQGRARAMHK